MARKDLHWLLIPFLVIISSFLGIWFNPSFGVSTDSRYYFKIAENLPKISESTFPIFYPLILKVFNLVFDDFLITSKVVPFISIVFIYLFTWKKNFFWKEFWFIFSLPSLVFCYFWSWSETVFLLLLLLFVYVNHRFLEEKKESSYVIINTLVLFLLFLTKYSALFVVFGYTVFSILQWLQNRQIGTRMLISVIIICILVLLYLFFNYFQTGYFTGPRGAPDFGKKNITYSIFNVFYSTNPIIHTRSFLGLKVNYFALFLITAALHLAIWIFFEKKKLKIKSISWLLITCSLSFLTFTIISYFTTNIDDLGARLLLPFVFLYYVTIVFIKGNFNKINNYLFYIALSSIIINLLNLAKTFA